VRRLLPLLLALAPVATTLAAPPKAILFDIGGTLVSRDRTWAPGAERALAVLRAAGIPVGLLSNTGTLSRLQLRMHHLPPTFRFTDFPDELVNLSSEARTAKPDPAAFRKAARKAGLAPNEILFLDEGLEHVMAAQHAGMLALRVELERDAAGKVHSSNVAELAEWIAAQASESGLPGVGRTEVGSAVPPPRLVRSDRTP
jgi:HAD superfamily hydrolase (TIGR01509 family)